jgi:signal transduction histidine kinase
VDAGYRFAQLGMRLMERFDERQFRCRILFIFNCLIRHWRDPVRDTLEPFLEAYRYGLDVGDLEFAAMSYWHHYHFGLQCGVELRTLVRDGEKYDHAIEPLKQETIRQVKNVCHQTVHNLMFATARPSMLLGDAYDETRELPARLAANDHFTIYVLHLYKAMLSCLFGEMRQCISHAATAVKHLDAVGSLSMATLGMYESLAALQLCTEDGGGERRALLRIVRRNQRRMKRWAQSAPMNYLHKFDLVDAELRALRGDQVGAMRAYEEAIVGARRSLFLHDEALANERAGLFHLARGRSRIARSYLLEARARYAFWGSTALANRIDLLHRDVLGDVHVDERNASERIRRADGTLDGWGDADRGAAPGAQGSLDFLSVLKASQAISREIDLEKLLKNMLSLVIENAGAEQGALLLERDGVLVIEAEGGTADETVRVLQALPMDAAAERLPLSVLHYVNRTRVSLVLDHAAKDDRFSADPCLLARPVLSVLCHPILRQGAVVGVVYLENSLSAGAFTQQHLEVLNILSSQMAVSLENATLYRETTRLNADLLRAATELEEYNRTLEHRVASRTQEIQTKNSELARLLRQLTETQNQLVMREKLASLGQVTAGVAHEIRNPLNFVLNFAMLSDDLLSEAKELLATLPEDGGAPATAVLRDIVSQLATNTARIRENGARADTIVRSMLELSRNKSGARREVDINALLEESMNLVYHGFCANDDAFDITIRKQLDPAVGTVDVIPEDVHRVLLNMLDNACYAVQRRSADAASPRADYVPTVTLQTSRHSEHVEIRIRDNGPGIPVAIREKIFNPFFTTKPPGQGAGLGLSLAYDIVVQGHRGEMFVESEEGAFTEFVLRLPSLIDGLNEIIGG